MSNRSMITYALAMLVICVPFILLAQPNLSFNEITLQGPGLTSPVDITGSGDGTNRLFVVEKRGTIRIIKNDTISSDYFLDIQNSVFNNNERGLLGLVFHPDFPTTPYFYVNYVAPGNTSHIARFTVNPADPDDALENSEKTILTLSQPYTNHNAGDLVFGIDGYLYIPLGDGGNGGDPENRSQNPQTLLGKMLRLDIDTDANTPYAIPANNPFVNNPAVLNEIWAFGLRNPWRISFDSETNDLWIADVGQNAWEEINMVPASSNGGENYGWKCWEGETVHSSGTDCSGYGTLVYPVFTYPQDDPDDIPTGWDLGVGFSVTGGFVYRGAKWPSLYGYYICADYVYNQVWLIKPSAGLLAIEVFNYDFDNQIANPTSFGEGDDKELYMVGLGGAFYKVESDDALAIESIHLEAHKSDHAVVLNWKIMDTSIDDANAKITIERSSDGLLFTEIGKMDYASGTSTFEDVQPNNGLNYYRIYYSNSSEQNAYSQVKRIRWGEQNLFEMTGQNFGNVFPIQISSSENDISMNCVSVDGKIIFEEIITPHNGSIYMNIDLSNVPAGMYFLNAKDGIRNQSERLVVNR